MTNSKLSQRKRKGVVLMIMAVAMMFIVIPAVGLAIDGAVVYTIRAKLQSATDAAAVSGARSFSKGLNPTAQQGAASTTAVKYFRANMNSAWNPLSAPDPTVTFPAASTPRTVIVNVASTAVAPTYFMKILNVNSVTVTAVSQAVRRDVKIMMVLDRSGSLQTAGACDDLREAAKGFVASFTDGRDELGMITFGTSHRVDFAIANNFKTASTPLSTIINNINCTGGTSSAAAYWSGYQQLVANPEQGVLNVLLFFTDGQPNTLHMTNLEVKSTSTCSSFSPKAGVVAPATNGVNVLGLYNPVQTSAPPVSSDQNFAANTSGCKFRSNASNLPQDIVALTAAGADEDEEVDAHGNLLTGYKSVNRTSGRIRIDHHSTVTNAATNALANAAVRARADASSRGLEMMTFAIGLGGAGAAEDEIMNRIANTAVSPSYDNTKPTGMYIRADNLTQLDEAFASLASETMRFAK